MRFRAVENPVSPLDTSNETIRIARQEFPYLFDESAIRVVDFVRYLVEKAAMSGFSPRGRDPMNPPPQPPIY